MIRFPPVDAAIEGFRVTREHPAPVLIWASLFLAFNLLSQAVVVGAGLAPVLEEIRRLGPDAGASVVMAAMQSSGGWFLLLFGLSVIGYVIVSTALLRAVLDPSRERFGFVGLGLDEARQLGLMVLIFVCTLVYAFACQLVSGVVVAAGGALPPALRALLKAAVLATLFLAFLYPAVRLSLAPSMTFADRRISLFRSWALTAGQFWGLFGAYVLATVLAVLVLLLSLVIFAALGLGLKAATNGAFDVVTMATPSSLTLESLLAPNLLVVFAFNAISTALMFVLTGSVAPAAFRLLSGRAGEPAR